MVVLLTMVAASPASASDDCKPITCGVAACVKCLFPCTQLCPDCTGPLEACVVLALLCEAGECPRWPSAPAPKPAEEEPAPDDTGPRDVGSHGSAMLF